MNSCPPALWNTINTIRDHTSLNKWDPIIFKIVTLRGMIASRRCFLREKSPTPSLMIPPTPVIPKPHIRPQLVWKFPLRARRTLSTTYSRKIKADSIKCHLFHTDPNYNNYLAHAPRHLHSDYHKYRIFLYFGDSQICPSSDVCLPSLLAALVFALLCTYACYLIV